MECHHLDAGGGVHFFFSFSCPRPRQNPTQSPPSFTPREEVSAFVQPPIEERASDLVSASDAIRTELKPRQETEPRSRCCLFSLFVGFADEVIIFAVNQKLMSFMSHKSAPIMIIFHFIRCEALCEVRLNKSVTNQLLYILLTFNNHDRDCLLVNSTVNQPQRRTLIVARSETLVSLTDLISGGSASRRAIQGESTSVSA